MDKTKKKTADKEKEPAQPKQEEQPPQQESTVSKSPEKSPRITNLKTIKVTFSVPNNILERIDFIFKIFQNDDLIYKNGNAPEKGAPIEEIAKYFATEYTTYPMILGAICYYISQTYKLDRANLDTTKPPEQDVNSVLKNGIGASEGIANLFIEFCKAINVKCQLVSGLVKRKTFKQGDSLRRHYWVAVNAGKTYFIDPSLFMGETPIEDEEKHVHKQFHPFYFFTPPELLINTHRPDNEDYQQLNKPLPLKTFLLNAMPDLETFYQDAFKHRIQFVSHPYYEFKAKDSEIDLKFNVENKLATGTMTYKGKPYDESNISVTYNEAEKYYVAHIKFQKDGPYTLTLHGKPMNTTVEKPSVPMLTYNINAAIINIIKPPLKKVLNNFNVRSSSVGKRDLSIKETKSEKRKLTKSASEFEKKKKMKCYDNKSAHLYEPKSDFLKVGQDTRFKVKIRGAKSVVVLDGKHWNYLKRKDDDVYEGIVSIKTSNVVVCMQKPGGVYTEVFEFYAIKPISNLPK